MTWRGASTAGIGLTGEQTIGFELRYAGVFLTSTAHTVSGQHATLRAVFNIGCMRSFFAGFEIKHEKKP